MMFTIGDVLFINEENSYYAKDAIVIVTNITYGNCNENYSTGSACDGVFYHVEVLEGDYYDWFMDDSPIARRCSLMVSNLNEAERLAVML